MNTKNAKVALLRSVPGLSGYHDRQLAQLAPLMDDVTVEAGGVLAREGTPGRQAFLIVEGEVSVHLRGELIATLGPGQFVGEMALLDHSPRSATVTAVTDVRLLVVDPVSFASLLQQPGVVRPLLNQLAQRLRDLEDAPSYDRPNPTSRTGSRRT